MEKQEIYILGRDEGESKRLNAQHDFFKVVTRGLVDQSIPLDRISSVADIATGTGIWLQDLSRILHKSTKEPRLHGFDISDAQFPAKHDGIKFSVHNALEPFPAEELGQYDLVNIRFLVHALKEHDYRTAVSNALSLLKPGGYLQWEEFDLNRTFISKPTQPPIMHEITRLLEQAIAPSGINRHAFETIHEQFQRAGLHDVNINHFEVGPDPALRERSIEWCSQGLLALLPPAIVRLKEAETKAEAVEKSKCLVREYRKQCPEWGIEVLRLARVVGRVQES